MAREKGYKLTEEMKRKMKEGRLAAKNRKPIPIIGQKPILHITGHEENGFDYWPAIRNSLRPLHQYDLCHSIEREVADRQIWMNNHIVLNILSKYFILEMKAGKPKRTRAPSTRVLTEEQKRKMWEGRQKKKALV